MKLDPGVQRTLLLDRLGVGMSRPYATVPIEELERIVDATANAATLRVVLDELVAHRNTRRARRLEARTEAKLSSGPDQKKGPDQSDLGLDEPPSAPRRRSRATPPPFTPTEEQLRARDAFMKGGSLKISAFAGSGKTSTLNLMANERQGRGIYLAFNRKIAREARGRFPVDVDCRTTHSVAAGAVRGQYAFSRDKMFKVIRANQLAAVLDLPSRRFEGALTLTGVQQAHLLSGAVKRFCQNAEKAITLDHVPAYSRLLGLPQSTQGEVKEWVLAGATFLWRRMCDPSDPVPIGHDGYLKLWALSDPLLPVEYILMDEAQDTNAAVLGVLQNQRAQMIFVGDRHQQIYEWRGAVNAMERIVTDHTVHLTQSFRFGEAIAAAASDILRALGEPERIVGNDEVESRICDSGTTDAVLARTNASVIAETLNAMEVGKRPHIVGGTVELEALVRDVFNLQRGEPGSHPDFFGFTSWDQVIAFSGTDEGEDLRPFVTLVELNGPRRLWAAIRGSVEDAAQADICISTAHKAKGAEWDSVRIADDFASVVTGGPIHEAEARLFYVAITRAKKTLVVSGEVLNAFRTAGSFTKEPLSRASSRQRDTTETPAQPRRARGSWFGFFTGRD